MVKNLTINLLSEICELFQVDKFQTTVYKPSTNGLVERWHRTLNAMLAKVVSSNQKDWDVHLPYVLCAYRSSRHESTGFSPNYLVLGRELRAPIDVVCGQPETERVQFESASDFVRDRQVLMDEAFRLVRQNLKASLDRNKKYYDLKVKPNKYEIGDFVYYFYPRKYEKKSQKWQKMYIGPMLVIKVLGPTNYLIQKSPRSVPLVVHVDKLKSYSGPALKAWVELPVPGTGHTPTPEPEIAVEVNVIYITDCLCVYVRRMTGRRPGNNRPYGRPRGPPSRASFAYCPSVGSARGPVYRHMGLPVGRPIRPLLQHPGWHDPYALVEAHRRYGAEVGVDEGLQAAYYYPMEEEAEGYDPPPAPAEPARASGARDRPTSTATISGARSKEHSRSRSHRSATTSGRGRSPSTMSSSSDGEGVPPARDVTIASGGRSTRVAAKPAFEKHGRSRRRRSPTPPPRRVSKKAGPSATRRGSPSRPRSGSSSEGSSREDTPGGGLGDRPNCSVDLPPVFSTPPRVVPPVVPSLVEQEVKRLLEVMIRNSPAVMGALCQVALPPGCSGFCCCPLDSGTAYRCQACLCERCQQYRGDYGCTSRLHCGCCVSCPVP